MNILAIIPCRRESRRVAGKNLMFFGGVPSLVRTIHHLQESRRRLPIVVVTDETQAAWLADSAGARSIRELKAVAEQNDLYEVIRYALLLAHPTPIQWDATILAYPNVPIRPAGYFDRLIDALEDSGADTARGVVPGRNWGIGSIFRQSALEAILRDRRAVQGIVNHIFPLQPEEAVEIDTMEDVSWAHHLLSSEAVTASSV